jgi:hypothetical protein
MKHTVSKQCTDSLYIFIPIYLLINWHITANNRGFFKILLTFDFDVCYSRRDLLLPSLSHSVFPRLHYQSLLPNPHPLAQLFLHLSRCILSGEVQFRISFFHLTSKGSNRHLPAIYDQLFRGIFHFLYFYPQSWYFTSSEGKCSNIFTVNVCNLEPCEARFHGLLTRTSALRWVQTCLPGFPLLSPFLKPRGTVGYDVTLTGSSEWTTSNSVSAVCVPKFCLGIPSDPDQRVLAFKVKCLYLLSVASGRPMLWKPVLLCLYIPYSVSRCFVLIIRCYVNFCRVLIALIPPGCSIQYYPLFH